MPVAYCKLMCHSLVNIALDYFQFDVSAGYQYQKFSVRAKVTNIFNKKLSYYVHDDNSVNLIAPTQVAATVAYKF